MDNKENLYVCLFIVCDYLFHVFDQPGNHVVD